MNMQGINSPPKKTIPIRFSAVQRPFRSIYVMNQSIIIIKNKQQLIKLRNNVDIVTVESWETKL